MASQVPARAHRCQHQLPGQAQNDQGQQAARGHPACGGNAVVGGGLGMAGMQSLGWHHRPCPF